MPIPNSDDIVARLKQLQADIRDRVRQSRQVGEGAAGVSRASSADTIYEIDAAVEPALESFCRQWARDLGPLLVVAEGLRDERGEESPGRMFPDGTPESSAALRLIVDPIDGTRGIMYDKRAAWSLAGVAPNTGRPGRLGDIEIAVMSELPTSKMGRADVLWAVRGVGARAERVDLESGKAGPLPLRPSSAEGIEHGFASVASFFPGTKRLSAELMERLADRLLACADVGRATVFDDQYISTGGQFYELIVGHDRFNADLRPEFYRIQGQPAGLCCHPYDCAAALIAEEAGVILTDAAGARLDGPLDTTTGLSWIGYANESLRRQIEPVVMQFLKERSR